MGLQKQLVEPRLIVEYACNALNVKAQQKKLLIVTKYDSNLPKINCHLEKTAWVLVNFLLNAIRYSPEGGKIIMEVKSDIAKTIFSVQDFTIGIESRYKEKVFERFYKIPNTGKAKTGTRLGLSISKGFIVAQGGIIWVESELNKGSKFAFAI